MTGPAPPRHLVVDASAVVALLIDAGPAGEWVTAAVSGAALSAPELMPYEAGNVLRRRAAAGLIDESVASLAHRDLTALGVDFYPYDPFADRTWQLRHNLSIYDAAYLALAEALEVPLVTLDARITRATGPRCPVLTPPD